MGFGAARGHGQIKYTPYRQMSITARDAQHLSVRNRDAQNVVFEKLWQRLDAEIRLSAEGGRHELFYRVPAFVFGLPRYDTAKVAKRMRVRLKNRGFQVSDDDTATIHINWKPPPKKKKIPPRNAPPPAVSALTRMRDQVVINQQLGW